MTSNYYYNDKLLFTCQVGSYLDIVLQDYLKSAREERTKKALAIALGYTTIKQKESRDILKKVTQ